MTLRLPASTAGEAMLSPSVRILGRRWSFDVLAWCDRVWIRSRRRV
ncbi:unnamed protein product [Brassica oleracea]